MDAFYVGQTDYLTQLNVLYSNTALPTVANNSGKYLYTNGTVTSWEAIPAQYSLPTATTSVLGGIKVDNSSITIANGVISVPFASTITAGIVKIDGSSLAYNSEGQLYYTGLTAGGMPIATTISTGGVKIDGSTIKITNGVISGFNGIFASLTNKPTTIAGYGITDTMTTIAITNAIGVETTRATTAEALLAPKANPIFTGTITGITKAMVGLNLVDNTSDTDKPVSTATTAAIKVETDRSLVAEALLAPKANPIFTGTVSGINKVMVGLDQVDNTSDITKPVSTATTAAILVETNRALTAEGLLAPKATTYTKTETDSRIQAIVGAAPEALNTLVEIATQLASDQNAASTLTTIVGTKAPIASPTFTGTVSGINKVMVGLDQVDNTSDIAKPVSTATNAAITVETNRAIAAETLLAPKANPTFTGTVNGIDKVMVGLNLVDNTADIDKPISTATTAAIAVETNRAVAAETLLAPKASPTFSGIVTFTGAVSGVSKSMVGLNLVDNTSDLSKPVSTATTAAIKVETDRSLAAEALLAPQATTYTKTETDSRIQVVVGTAPANLNTLEKIAAQLAINEYNTNSLLNIVSLKATIASPTFTGTVSGISKAMVGLNLVDNTADIDKPVSTATTAAIAIETTRATAAESTKAPQVTTYTKVETDINIQSATAAETTRATIAEALLAPKANPTFTGTATFNNAVGITKAMVGLDNVNNTADIAKPVSTATSLAITAETNRALTAEALLAPQASPTFTGTATFTNVVGISKAMVGLDLVDNTTDLSKPVSTLTAQAIANAQATAISAVTTETSRAIAAEALLSPQATTYTKTETDSRIQAIVGAAPAALDTLAELAAQLATDATGVASLTTVVGTKAPIASPTFTGTVSGISKAMVGLNLVDNTSDIDKPVSTATTTAIAIETTRATAAETLLAPKAGPTFTGTATFSGPVTFSNTTIAGLNKGMVGLDQLDNIAQLPKDQQLALTGDIIATATNLNSGTITTALSTTGVTAGTYKSLTVDVKGRVTGGTNPTTLSGYGITDAATTTDLSTEVTRATTAEELLAPKANPTFTGTVTAPGIVLTNYSSVKAIFEEMTISNITMPGAASTIAIDVITSPSTFFINSMNGSIYLNIRGNATTALSTILPVGKAVTIVALVFNSAGSYGITSINIDGVAQTVNWANGLTPTGDFNAKSAFSFSIIRFGSTPTSYTILGSKTKFG